MKNIRLFCFHEPKIPWKQINKKIYSFIAGMAIGSGDGDPVQGDPPGEHRRGAAGEVPWLCPRPPLRQPCAHQRVCARAGPLPQQLYQHEWWGNIIIELDLYLSNFISMNGGEATLLSRKIHPHSRGLKYYRGKTPQFCGFFFLDDIIIVHHHIRWISKQTKNCKYHHITFNLTKYKYKSISLYVCDVWKGVMKYALVNVNAKNRING